MEAGPPRGGSGERLGEGKGGLDAAILGVVAMRQAGLTDRTAEVLDPKAWLPEPGEGALALVARHPIAEATALDPLPTRPAPPTELAPLARPRPRPDAPPPTLAPVRRLGIGGLVWCGGGSPLVPDDTVTFGARFVAFFAETFMGLRHRDKAHQLELLDQSKEIEWIGVRPLQIRQGPRRGEYRVGFHAFSGLSWISFADVAHAMIGMLDDDRWLHKAPIIQY